MFVIGLTGGIGSGKTAVSNYFQSLGITVVDTDIVAREVVEPGKVALDKISEHFGESILLDNGSLDRGKLRELIFNQPEEKQWLEELLHPLILERSRKQLQQANSSYAILVSPLLIEARQTQDVSRILIVDVPEAIQIQRTCKRDQKEAQQVQAIIDSQLSRQERLQHADDVIVNNSDLESLHSHIKQLHQQYLELATTHEQ
ncbi:MAG: dephospho-CoA kinase [Cellvibrionaceae bacterium]